MNHRRLLVFCLVACLGACSPPTPDNSQAVMIDQGEDFNFLFILLDDLDSSLGTLETMTHVQE